MKDNDLTKIILEALKELIRKEYESDFSEVKLQIDILVKELNNIKNHEQWMGTLDEAIANTITELNQFLKLMHCYDKELFHLHFDSDGLQFCRTLINTIYLLHSSEEVCNKSEELFSAIYLLKSIHDTIMHVYQNSHGRAYKKLV